jgi:hypothetical protein
VVEAVALSACSASERGGEAPRQWPMEGVGGRQCRRGTDARVAKQAPKGGHWQATQGRQRPSAVLACWALRRLDSWRQGARARATSTVAMDWGESP